MTGQESPSPSSPQAIPIQSLHCQYLPKDRQTLTMLFPSHSSTIKTKVLSKPVNLIPPRPLRGLSGMDPMPHDQKRVTNFVAVATAPASSVTVKVTGILAGRTWLSAIQ